MRVPAIPYKGSKARIAMDLINVIPPATTFYDLFAGGGAMTSAALMSKKYKRVVMNDVSLGLCNLYVDAIRGECRDRYEWVSREDFYAKKDSDPFIRFVWSFGNNGRDYMYSREIEPIKHALHEAIIHDNTSLYTLLGFTVPQSGLRTIQERKSFYRKWWTDFFKAQNNKTPREYIDCQGQERACRLAVFDLIKQSFHGNPYQNLTAYLRLLNLERVDRVDDVREIDKYAIVLSTQEDDIVKKKMIPYPPLWEYPQEKQFYPPPPIGKLRQH